MENSDKLTKYQNSTQKNGSEHPAWLMNFIDVYQLLRVDNLGQLKQIYHTDIHFKDPMHEIKGFTALEAYFTQLYTHLTSCDFIITDVLSDQETAAIYWEMRFTHKQLNKGKSVLVAGHSHLKGGIDGVYYHRDYVDLGAMLYEHIPLVGCVIKAIKKRAVK